MDYFTAIPEGQAITHINGVYRQIPIFERGGKIYARHGAGYVRLFQGGQTSAPNVRWSDIDTPMGQWTEHTGYVFYEGQPEAAE